MNLSWGTLPYNQDFLPQYSVAVIFTHIGPHVRIVNHDVWWGTFMLPHHNSCKAVLMRPYWSKNVQCIAMNLTSTPSTRITISGQLGNKQHLVIGIVIQMCIVLLRNIKFCCCFPLSQSDFERETFMYLFFVSFNIMIYRFLTPMYNLY